MLEEVATPALASLYELSSICIHITHNALAALYNTCGLSTTLFGPKSPDDCNVRSSFTKVQLTRSCNQPAFHQPFGLEGRNGKGDILYWNNN
jgi:hypothetical protein